MRKNSRFSCFYVNPCVATPTAEARRPIAGPIAGARSRGPDRGGPIAGPIAGPDEGPGRGVERARRHTLVLIRSRYI